MNAQKWLASNKSKLSNQWERLFVDTVLSEVSELDWRSVTAQFPFQDRDGKQRYADFAISEGDHVRIVIEIDGYDKKGRGTGMTKAEFIDWQRRQNALVDLGWAVLRFANKDVRDHSARCVEHITLLLRKQRHLGDHIQYPRSNDTEEEKKEFGEQVRETPGDYRVVKKEGLQYSWKQKTHHDKVHGLDEKEAKRLADLNRMQRAVIKKHRRQIQSHVKENSVMKTAIWAFASILIVTLILLVYVLVGQQNQQQSIADTQSESHTETYAPLGQDCRNPAEWSSAVRYEGQQIALRGPIAGIRYRPELSGKPTWINIGADFPTQNRLVFIVWGRNRSLFEDLISNLRVGQVICALGDVSEYQGVSQIELVSPDQIYTF